VAISPGTWLVERYRADALLGRGGMGEVWRCHDREAGRDVAIKRVRAEVLRDPQIARLFDSEVVAVARLSHPGIVPVYDLLRDEHGDALLVMELRSGGHLGAFGKRNRSWPALREVLVQILEALAYAHARGVLHLDIKPENVLVAPDLRVTLLDFGIARVQRPGRGVERWFERDAVIGTVEYMAPEQCAGTFERFGPWSDLFSVGAVAFELVAGYRPFPGASDRAGLVRRLSEPPPHLVPSIVGAPTGLATLCRSLLALEPRDRPASAADVIAELCAIDQSRIAAAVPADLEPSSSATAATAPTAELPLTGARAATAPTTSLAVAAAGPTFELDPVAPSPSSAAAISIPPPADRVERAFTAEASAPPAGAYGLFGLRDLPVLGRVEERRAVWSAVRAAAMERRTRVVLLEGPAGVGKSRLARDAMERAVELGLCTPMQTAWSERGAGDEGLRGLIENLLDTRGARETEVRARLDFWLDRLDGQRRRARRDAGPRDRRAFVREVLLYLRPTREAAPDAGLPLRVVIEAISAAAEVRPVILWLDDVQWSRGEAAALLGALAQQSPELPVCALATVRSEEIADRAAYEALATGPGVARVPVDRLDLDATRRLVRGLLDVEDSLCDALAARAEGNPLFVGLMLRQLVLADAVARSEGRYRLAGAFDLDTLPADVDALMARRIEQSGAPQRELSALALVRERVSLEVARELAQALGAAFDAAIGRALAAGLLHIEGGAYVWEHGLLREHLITRVAPADAAPLHAIAARALLPLVDREDAAGELRAACEAMLDAGQWSARRAEAGSRIVRFLALAAWAREGRFLDLEARGLAEVAHACAETRDMARAEEALAAAQIAIERGAGDAAASWVWLRRSQVVRLGGRVDEGVRATEEALTRARRAGEREVERLALIQMGIDRCRGRDLQAARALTEEAVALCRAAGDRVGESSALRTLVYVSEGREALDLAERAMDLARSAGALRVELVNKQVWVDLLWRSGAREEARREARALAEEAGRRALRQTVSLLELQSAAWAASEDDWTDARAHRDAAARWGAATGALPEQLVLAALDVDLALAAGDLVAAEAALAPLEASGSGLDDATLQEVLAQAAAMAPPALAARIAAVARPRTT
jgi:serine/threonine protein kinase